MARQAKIVKVYIGRFQPFHKGHLRVLRSACLTSDLVVVVIGSADAPVSKRNPWPALMRQQMIRAALTTEELEVVRFVQQCDVAGDDEEWAQDVRKRVSEIATQEFPYSPISYGLIGCHKGADTYYLKLYKDWALETVPHHATLEATNIRRNFFSGYRTWEEDVPPTTITALHTYVIFARDQYNKIAQEFGEEYE